MIKRKYVLTLALAFCLTLTLFIAASVGYDAWVDLDDDGVIDANDLNLLANEYGTSGTPINKTALLLELQSKIDSLNATVTSLEVEINDLQSDLNAETAARENADAAEEQARIAGDAGLQSQINTLQSQMLPQGYVRAPAYDSGWVSINPDMALTFAHNLGTTEVLVYVIGKQLGATKINQAFYGGAYPTGSVLGLYWFGLDDTSIRVHRTANDAYWEQVRVMIWKIQ